MVFRSTVLQRKKIIFFPHRARAIHYLLTFPSRRKASWTVLDFTSLIQKPDEVSPKPISEDGYIILYDSGGKQSPATTGIITN